MKAIITGSSKGLGLAIAEGFVTQNIDVAISSRNEEGLTKAIDHLKGINPNAKVIGYAVDFGDENDVEDYVGKVKSEFQDIDILVNNVGMYAEDKVLDDKFLSNLEKQLNVNFFGAVRISQPVVKWMKEKKSGIIINTISVAAKNLRPEASAYSISKLALKSYSDLLRESVKSEGIKVLSMYPGAMNTSSWDGEDVDRSNMIQMSDMISLIKTAMNLTSNAQLEEFTIDTMS